MDKHIQELYEQAHERKPVVVLDAETYRPTDKIGHGGQPMYQRVFNPEKFTKLIVSEVLDKVAQRSASWSDEFDRPYIELEFGFGPFAEDKDE